MSNYEGLTPKIEEDTSINSHEEVKNSSFAERAQKYLPHHNIKSESVDQRSIGGEEQTIQQENTSVLPPLTPMGELMLIRRAERAAMFKEERRRSELTIPNPELMDYSIIENWFEVSAKEVAEKVEQVYNNPDILIPDPQKGELKVIEPDPNRFYPNKPRQPPSNN